jgi:hypothetical protein
MEAAAYKRLQAGLGIGKLYWYGTEGECNVMVMELLGPSLEKLRTQCKDKLSLGTVFALGEQMVRA